MTISDPKLSYNPTTLKIVERRRIILEVLQQKGSADINELSERLHVSSMTVRRDLKELAGTGSISIRQGTAVLNDGALREYNMLVKHDINIEEKRRIAQKCFEYVSDGDSIFLDAGTTVKELAELICRCNESVNILTHSLLAANALRGINNSRLIMCPVEYRDMSMAFLGALADDFIQRFQIDVLFLSTEGVSISDGLSVVDVADGHAKRIMIEHAKKVVLMADSSKFEKTFFYKIAPVSSIDVIVTDTDLDDSQYEEYQLAGVEVVRV